MRFARSAGALIWLTAVVAAVLALAGAALPAHSDRDGSFAAGAGFQLTDFGQDEQAAALALMPDGDIVLAGGRNDDTTDFDSDDFVLARYTAAGAADPTFGGGDGKLVSDFGGDRDEARAIAAGPAGTIVVGGWNGGDFQLARYLPNGELDPSFSGDGTLTTNLGGADFVADLALAGDGKIIAVGGTSEQFALARYLTDGTLDSSFGGDGTVTTDFGGAAADAVALLPDGRIVAAGAGLCDPFCRDFALARYLDNGTLDPSFDGDGKLTTDFGGYDTARDLVLQADGKLVAGGHGGPTAAAALARYLPDGSLDASFAGDGTVLLAPGIPFADISALALTADGRIIAGGNFARPGEQTGKFDLVRLDGAGNLDPAFGGDGRVEDDFGRPANHLADLALDGQGRIVAAGLSADGSHRADFALARYLPSGDTIGPEAAIAGGPAQGSYTRERTASFPLAGTDAPGPVELSFLCQLDGRQPASCSSPVSYSGLEDGLHRFQLRAKDAAGNLQVTPASRTWTVDGTAPQARLRTAPPRATRSSRARFGFSGTDATSPPVRFECSLDGKPARACTSPQLVRGLRQGRHRFAVTAIDQAGNRDTSPAVHAWTVDRRPPTAPVVRGPRRTVSATPFYRLSAKDSVTKASALRFRCRLNTRRLRRCAARLRLHLAPGKHVLHVEALDEAGNRSPSARVSIVRRTT